MFPLIAIGGAISAAMSIAKGVGWLAEQFDSSKTAAATSGKGESRAASFDAALSAQVAGQKQPAAAPLPTSIATLRGPDLDALARMQAGILAYGQIGEKRDGQDQTQPVASTDNTVVRS